MFSNPLIERYRYSLMRPRQFGIYVGIYATIAALILLITLTAYTDPAGIDIDGMSRSLFAQFTTLQVLVLWIWSSINVASAIRDERRDRSYDFFKLLPLQPWKKAVGIVVGKNLVAYLLGGITFILLVPSAIVASVPLGILGELIFLILSVSIFLSLLALLSSVAQRQSNRNRTTSPIVLVFIGFLAIGPLFSTLGSLTDTDQMKLFTIPFMAWETRGALLIGAIALYLGVWIFKGICRQFRIEQAPMFTGGGSIGFMCGALAIMLGLFIPHFRGNSTTELCVIFWGIALGLSTLITVAAFRPFNEYIEEGAGKLSPPSGLLRFTLMKSNLKVVLSVLTLCMVVGVLCGIACHIGLAEVFVWLPTLALFSLFYVLLFEAAQVYRSVCPKIHILLTFIGLLHLILPLILAGVSSENSFAVCSPLGYFTVLCGPGEKDSAWINGIWALNLSLCILAFLAITHRYKVVLSKSGG